MLRTLSVVVLLCGMLVGCSHQDFTTTPVHNPLPYWLDSRKPYVPAEAGEAERRMARFGQALAARRAEATADERAGYPIGAGDELRIEVFGLEAPAKTSEFIRSVSREGAITLPWIGCVKASKTTTDQLEQSVRAAYADGYIKDPQVSVTLAKRRSLSVTVTGAVAKPGVYPLERSSSTLLDVLAMAGGPTEQAGDALLLIQALSSDDEPDDGDGAKETTPISVGLEKLIVEGDITLNLAVHSGDIVTVPPRRKAYVYLLGYVQRPGAYELVDGVRVNALRAVAMGGGLAATARPANSYLVRETPKGRTVVSVNLIKLARGIRPPLYLEAGDTLVVGSSLMARLSEYVRPRANVGVTGGL